MFRKDINMFFSTIPDESRFHEDRINKKLYAVQHERLTRRHNHLDFLCKDEKEYFGVALHFTVLVDEVCYTSFKEDYSKFQALTNYPKLIGNCMSWCYFHLRPEEIFAAMNTKRNLATTNHLAFKEKFIESVETMEFETVSFFKEHLPEIDGKTFWKMCKNEFPY
jgi:hypothetical protein